MTLRLGLIFDEYENEDHVAVGKNSCTICWSLRIANCGTANSVMADLANRMSELASMSLRMSYRRIGQQTTIVGSNLVDQFNDIRTKRTTSNFSATEHQKKPKNFNQTHCWQDRKAHPGNCSWTADSATRGIWSSRKMSGWRISSICSIQLGLLNTCKSSNRLC